MKTNVLTKEKARKYLRVISKNKNLTFGELAMEVGILDPILREQLSVFDPMVRMFEDYNVCELRSAIEEFITPSLSKKKVTKRVRVEQCETVADFVYKFMTIPGGIVDTNVDLTLPQLRALRRLVSQEIKEKKEASK